MAFDGLTICALQKELYKKLINGRINKIAQTEKDELLLTIKSSEGQFRLLLSANPTLPLAYLTSVNKPAPLTAPNFCMLLRKHINNGRITDISQPGLERILDIKIDHLDEMGDPCVKHLIIEMMGKHSNIIFTDDNSKIIDSIKRINASVSSVREVLPGYEYFIPNTDSKVNPIKETIDEFANILSSLNLPSSAAIYKKHAGISPNFAEECCYDAGIDSDIPACELSDNERLHLGGIFLNKIQSILNDELQYNIIYDNNKPIDFIVYSSELYNKNVSVEYDSVSSMLEAYYSEKDTITRIHQKSADLRQIISTIYERDVKKLDLQEKQLADTEKRDKYKVYGELLNTYGYNIEEGAKSFDALNYYTNEMITIPLDETLTARENSVKYFAKYNKLKRTFEALSALITETKSEVDYLESVLTSLDIATSYDDLLQIKEELVASGFIREKKQNGKKTEKSKSKPLHYISSDGYDIFVGKNNIQNEEVTFKIASGNDWWFHAKNMPGSHVIVKSNGNELPDRVFEEAAALAAYYSKGREQEKVEIDYIERKHVKKANGGAPGFVIYHTNYSMNIAPDNSLKIV